MRIVLNSKYLPVAASATLAVAGIILNYTGAGFFTGPLTLVWFAAAYIIVARGVLANALREMLRFSFSNEFFLMSVATLGAFAIGEYAEAVAVMLFYEVGELLQENAVNRAKSSIRSLLDMRPLKAVVRRGGKWTETDPRQVKPGELVYVRKGEKIPLDGEMITESATIDTSALTGESTPSVLSRGDAALAGSINLGEPLKIKTTKIYEESSYSRIIRLVEEANKRKAPTERFMRRFARYYTPFVMAMAALIIFVPWVASGSYSFNIWLYRALVFLVIACPCALYVSIPLGYFGGIGAAAKNGILYKGADFIDRLKKLHTLLIDKTGTLTKGVFMVREYKIEGFEESEALQLAAALEGCSTHPAARAIAGFADSGGEITKVVDVEEFPGLGIKGTVNGKDVVAGNEKMMKKFDLNIENEIPSTPYTVIYIAIEGRYAGYFVIADQVKDDSRDSVSALKSLGVRQTVILSGDSQAITSAVARETGIDQAYGDLLPEEKLSIVRKFVDRGKGFVAFAGDGINDAPSISVSDVGIAMGAMGSDLAIESADVVIQTDRPSAIERAVRIARSTSRIVWQNIFLVFAVKLVFLTLGALGIATMWGAVFADMGVALAAIFNAVRIQQMKF